jgi:hypothetical protein
MDITREMTLIIATVNSVGKKRPSRTRSLVSCRGGAFTGLLTERRQDSGERIEAERHEESTS